MKSSFKEEVNRLRNKANYDEDILKNDVDSTGIRENSIFNNVKHFHVVNNFSVDILHDIFEGVLKYDFCNLILMFIQNGIFDLELLNIRKQTFNYGETEIGNISQPFQMIHLKNKNIKLSGREMLTFAHFFPLIVGDLVKDDNKLWLFVINLIELLDLLLLSEFNALDIINLEQHILFHNREYTTIFSDVLKPKHHFLNHYCNIIKQSGPLKYLWTFPFESKHRELKLYTKNINSRKNAPVSLGLKLCLQFSEFISNFEINDYSLSKKKYTAKDSQYFNKLLNKISENELIDCIFFQNIIFHGTLYKKDFVIYTYHLNLNAYKIKEIFVLHRQVFLLCQKLEILTYKKHYLSYLIGSELEIFELYKPEELKFPPVHLYTVQNEKFLRLKNFF